MKHSPYTIVCCIAFLLLASASSLWSAPIAIEETPHDGPVDFEKEILPLLRRSCLACHNATDAESKFIAETPASILKGGSDGPAVIPGKGAESLLLRLAAHQQDPVMPPKDNDVKAPPLAPRELGLLKRWIDEGAKGAVTSASASLQWQPLPPGMNAIFAVAITPDGQYAAASRGNQVFLYHVPSRVELGRLTDPALIERGLYKQPGVADVDAIQSLRFNADGSRLASGGFRAAKIWRRPEPTKGWEVNNLEGAPLSLTVSADGKWLAVGLDNGKIVLATTDNGQIVKTLSGHAGPVSGLAFSADSSRLLSGARDKTCRVWNVNEAREIGSVETPSSVNAVAWAMNEQQVATAGDDNKVRLWSVPGPKVEGQEPPKPVRELNHNGAVTAVQSHQAGAQLVTASADGQTRVWDVASGNQLKSWGHGPLVGAVVTPDGKFVVSASSNNSLKFMNGENGQTLGEVRGDFRATLALNEANRLLTLAQKNVQTAQNEQAEAGKRKTAEEENVKKSKEELTKAEMELKTRTEAAKQPVAEKEAADQALATATKAKADAEAAKKLADEAIAPAQALLQTKQNERNAAQQAFDAAMKEHQAATEKLNQAKDAAAKDAANTALADAVKQAEAALTAAEEKRKAATAAKEAADKAGSDAEAAKKQADEKKQQADKAVSDTQNAFNQADQKVKQVTPNAMKALDELNNADRNLKAAQRSVPRAEEALQKVIQSLPGYDEAVQRWQNEVGQATSRQQAAQAAVPTTEKPWKGIALSPDATTVATVGEYGAIQVWDVATSAPRETIAAQKGSLTAVVYAGRRVIATSADKAIIAYDLSDEWKLERVIGSPDNPEMIIDRVTALDFSHNGQWLATGSGDPSRSGEVKIWSTSDGNLVRTLKDPHSDSVFGVAFSPDDTQLATCGADRFLKLFNVSSGELVRSFEGHTHHVTGVAWRADGRLLATCGADAAVKVWDARTGEQLRTIQGLNKEGTSLQFVSVGDDVLVSGGANLVRQVNATNGGTVRDFGGSADYVFSVAVSADAKSIIAGGQDGVLRMWADNGQPIRNFDPPAPPASSTPGK